MKPALITLLSILALTASAQNLFPVKLDRCKPDRFCLDCGNIKAGYDTAQFLMLVDKLNKDLQLQGIQGAVKFQVLIDSKGRACVLSHTDQSNSRISSKIVDALTSFKHWTPAVSGGTNEERTSINLLFSIRNNRLSGQIERVDMNVFKKSFDKPRNPEIYNKSYVYKNEHLSNYKFTVWNSNNSNLPNNMNDDLSIDQTGLVWLTVDEGLVTFDGKDFKNADQDITDKGRYFGYYALATDNNNTKWVYGKKNIYSFDNSTWTRHDSSAIGIDGAYQIVNNAGTGEVFFCADEGLVILKGGKWTTISQHTYKDLPSNRVAYAKRDRENRIWIGTFSGTAMIDANGTLTNFEQSDHVLKGKCITSMDEDEDGNLYFTLFEFNRSDKGKINADEGIAIRDKNGNYKQLTTANSGMPFNHATCLLYDRTEKILWISTDRAGLVRYDLKNGWENYHNENSDLPTSYISTMAFDADGALYLATRQGLVKIARK